MTDAVAGVIAAAGRSTRMGAPKALLDADGTSFLFRVMDTLREGGASPLLVVVSDLAGPIPEEAIGCGGELILNPDPSDGPISSLRAGLRSLPPEVAAVLFSPVDHPLFRASTVRALIQGFLETRPPLLVPVFQARRGHPVLLGREVFPELLEEHLSEGARTVVHRYLHERLQVPVDDPGILANINTPEDYRRHFP
jgi:molybdenum cofactor cytidylyltransferase